MGITAWQRELLSTLSRLDAGFARLEEGQQEMRQDIRTLTRVVVRRFGTAGTPSPQVGDHVLFHVRAEAALPAVVLAADGDRLDLEVFGTDVTTPSRFPRGVPKGTAPGCWSFPA